MKLRNKTTGEIGCLISTNWNETALTIMDKDGVQLAKYTSLAELNTEWEDYEKPKTFFTIYYDGTISEFKDGDDEQIRDMKEIGNYFDTREEAEKAVEKLRIWKVIKDMGFKIVGIRYRDNKNYIEWNISRKVKDDDFMSKAFNEALHWLFGGKE